MPNDLDLLDDELGYDDDMGDDDAYGLSERGARRLLEKRQKLLAVAEVSGPKRRRHIANVVNRIDKKLARAGYSASVAAAADAIAASGVQGIGGLQFQAQSPPGLGRLVRLPFYPTVGNAVAGDPAAGTVTSAGFGLPSTTNPVFIEVPSALLAGTSPGAHLLFTPQISWATLRIVGFESQMRTFRGIAETGPSMTVSDLKIGGGANLFTHEEFADAEIYDADQPEFAGLRDYPLLRSPNQAEVLVKMVGNVSANAITYSCALLCEVLVDDNYGAHIPGPYARPGALVRQGGSFVG